MGAFSAERTVKVVPLQLFELGKWVHSEKVGAFRANRTENVGAFRANKAKKVGLYRGTYPYCFDMGAHPRGCVSVSNYYAPNFEKVGRAYCFRLVCVWVCVCVRV